MRAATHCASRSASQCAPITGGNYVEIEEIAKKATETGIGLHKATVRSRISNTDGTPADRSPWWNSKRCCFRSGSSCCSSIQERTSEHGGTSNTMTQCRKHEELLCGFILPLVAFSTPPPAYLYTQVELVEETNTTSFTTIVGNGLQRAPMRHVVGGRAALADKRAASASEVGRFETDIINTSSNLKNLMDLSGEWIDKVQQRKPPKQLILDLDSSVSETYGEQEGTLAAPVITRCFCSTSPAT